MVGLGSFRPSHSDFVFRIVEDAHESAIGSLCKHFVGGRHGNAGLLAGYGRLAEVVLGQLAQLCRILGPLRARGFLDDLHHNLAAGPGEEVIVLAGACIFLSDVFPKSSNLHD